mmetsp:Transcript_16151/g.37087  ORF Transcript_16151/g.37087 Transcript_16151/m.37087 type:complete len:81 (-) Transcript_16151:615-857(-)
METETKQRVVGLWSLTSEGFGQDALLLLRDERHHNGPHKLIGVQEQCEGAATSTMAQSASVPKCKASVYTMPEATMVEYQ